VVSTCTSLQQIPFGQSGAKLFLGYDRATQGDPGYKFGICGFWFIIICFAGIFCRLLIFDVASYCCVLLISVCCFSMCITLYYSKLLFTCFSVCVNLRPFHDSAFNGCKRKSELTEEFILLWHISQKIGK
jgi:hypothetical protein